MITADAVRVRARVILAFCLVNFCLFQTIIAWEGALVFDEDFVGHRLRTHLWDYDEGCGGMGPKDINLECFKKGTNNILVENGSLIITARVEASKELTLGKTTIDMKYSSGRIIQSGFKFSYGTYVIRARMPKGKHLFPSIYLLPMNQRHDNSKYEEIDIVQARGQRLSTIMVGAHFGRTYTQVVTKNLEKVFRNTDLSRDFHEYTLNWAPTRLTWYFDKKKVFEATTHYISDWSTNSGDNIPRNGEKAPFVQRSSLVIGLGVGGRHFPYQKFGNLTEEEAQAWEKPTLEIDSVRVYDNRLTEPKEKFTVFNIPGIDGLVS